MHKYGTEGSFAQSPRAETLHAVLENMPQGTILCDCHSKLLYANSVALSFLSAADGIQLDRGMVIAAHEDGKALRAAVAQACHKTAPRAETLFIRRAAGTPLVVSAAPVPEGEATRWALLLVHALSDLGEQAIYRLQHLFRLSPAEAEIAVKLANGLSLAEIADERQVSLGTVRTQLKSLAPKLGCRRQVEIAVLVGSISHTGPVQI